MLKPKTVDVTQEDIHQGICKNPEMCAIALALAHAYKDEVDYIEVNGYESIKMSSLDDRWWYVNVNPDDDIKICRFIEDFDDGKNVKPMSFKIDSIEEH